MERDLFTLIEHSESAYIVVDMKNLTITSANLLGKSFYLLEESYVLLKDIFSIEMINEWLKGDDKATVLKYKNIRLEDKYGKVFFSDIEVRYINDNELCVILTPVVDMCYKKYCGFIDVSIKPTFILKLNEDFEIMYANKSFYNYTYLHDFETNFIKDLACKERQMQLTQELQDVYISGNQLDIDIKLKSRESGYQLIRLIVYRVQLKNDEYILIGEIISLSRRLALLEKFEEQEAYFDVMQDLSKDIIFKIDIDKKIMHHRSDIAAIFGIPSNVGNFPESVIAGNSIHPDDLEPYTTYAYNMVQGIGGTMDVRIKLIDGTFCKYRIVSRGIFNSLGLPIYTIGKLLNIQELAEMEEKASLDLLTKTLNKVSFQEKITEKLDTLQTNQKHALVFIDIDNFKHINDHYGHSFGDFILSTICMRMKRIIRDNDIIGRVGGDEFVIFLENFGDEQVLLERMEELLSVIGKEYVDYDGEEEKRTHCYASIGVSIFPDHGSNYEEVYKTADSALYKSKNSGKNIITIYSNKEMKN